MSPRILVVEDHDDTRLLMAAMLGARGYGVETARGYGEGLRLAGAGSYDLILLDYRYADGAGTELCRRIRESDRETPILFFSGVDPRLQREALSCGAQGFVLKPNFDDLWGEVSRPSCCPRLTRALRRALAAHASPPAATARPTPAPTPARPASAPGSPHKSAHADSSNCLAGVSRDRQRRPPRAPSALLPAHTR